MSRPPGSGPAVGTHRVPVLGRGQLAEEPSGPTPSSTGQRAMMNKPLTAKHQFSDRRIALTVNHRAQSHVGPTMRWGRFRVPRGKETSTLASQNFVWKASCSRDALAGRRRPAVEGGGAAARPSCDADVLSPPELVQATLGRAQTCAKPTHATSPGPAPATRHRSNLAPGILEPAPRRRGRGRTMFERRLPDLQFSPHA